MGKPFAALNMRTLLARLRVRMLGLTVKALAWLATSPPAGWIADWHAGALVAVALSKTDAARISLADVLPRRRDTDP